MGDGEGLADSPPEGVTIKRVHMVGLGQATSDNPAGSAPVLEDYWELIDRVVYRGGSM